MHARNLRYFTFVSRFVDAVTTDALSRELLRLRRGRLRVAALPVAEPNHLLTPAKAA